MELLFGLRLTGLVDRVDQPISLRKSFKFMTQKTHKSFLMENYSKTYSQWKRKTNFSEEKQ
jgi:hypothetical protein